MRVATRLVAFGAILALAFSVAALVGASVNPAGEGPPSGAETRGRDHAEPAAARREGHGGGHAAATRPAASGLAVSQEGLTLRAERAFFTAGRPGRFVFRIADARGRVLRDEFEVEAEREMHLIVVRRDTADYQHLHPRKGQGGAWSVDLELPEGGVYRAFADFMVGGRQRTLATDLFVPGEFQPESLPGPISTASADGYEVRLSAPSLRAGRESELSFRVSREGRAEPALEPYLGARGHLVALREGDLAYLHVHPAAGASSARAPHAREGSHPNSSDEREAGEDDIPFAATFPTPGRYRLFLQFRAAGRVRTVDYTLEVPR